MTCSTFPSFNPSKTKVHRRADEPGVLGIVAKVGEKGYQVFGDLAPDDRLALLDGILSDHFLRVLLPTVKEEFRFLGRLPLRFLGPPSDEMGPGTVLDLPLELGVFPQRIDQSDTQCYDQGHQNRFHPALILFAAIADLAFRGLSRLIFPRLDFACWSSITYSGQACQTPWNGATYLMERLFGSLPLECC